MSTEDAYETMTREESLRLLANEGFGRLAYSVAGRPDIVPINLHVDSGEDGRVYFRTSEGSKLFAVTVNQTVAIETERFRQGYAESVVVHGYARELDTEAEIEVVEEMGLRSWVPTAKYHYIEVTPEEVTGRRYRLGDEPE